MNFCLSNITLARIWGVSRDKIAKNRVQHKRGAAKWDAKTYRFNFSMSEFDAFVRAVKKEQAKAQKLNKGGGELRRRLAGKL